MIMYDWTMGRPGAKKDKNFKAAFDHYLTKSNIKGDINCKLLIVAPDFFVEEYLDWWRNHRNLKNSPNYKEEIGMVKPTLPEINLSYSFKSQIEGIIY
jgi:hypothetical protein